MTMSVQSFKIFLPFFLSSSHIPIFLFIHPSIDAYFYSQPTGEHSIVVSKFIHVFMWQKLWPYFYRDEEEGEPHSKKELIELAKEIATASKEIVKLGQKACEKCNDKRLKSVRAKISRFFFDMFFSLVRALHDMG